MNNVLECNFIIPIFIISGSDEKELIEICKKRNIINFTKIYGSPANKFVNFKNVYFPFGVIYLSKVNTYLKYKNFYNRKTMFYKIKTSQCYEIDDIHDFICVQAVIKKIGRL